ncbi:MBL fold metallo-hydrolase [Marinactinospora thermotolerans]|uniref:Glyoxylase, beta-lactamase superfamily II n=1 Tax=Marinactinospora thermotolerans DSM 45154 TaxID=1122192 RepID=A0A1T4SBI8_9ACTN|nr:MBL fold metallo-hydrolase [Marinactinospora thermotolerans]SKA25599.1 Glyoxylase, beta-lactamase superfamily II [Marinactinospora thermotolerans DSM 45154]
MFWKRKDKKKAEQAEEVTGTGGTETETVEEAGDEEKTPDTAATADSTDSAKETAEKDAPAIQRVEIPGKLEVDGEEHDVLTNTWIVPADDEGVIVIDPADDAEAILEAVGDREIYLVACTNGYAPHIAGAVAVAERDEAPIALHARELRAWRKLHGIERKPDWEVEGGGVLDVGDLEVEILPTPGTAPGSVSYYIASLGVVFSGDTLVAGNLGTVGGGYVDYTRQLASVGEILLSLPPKTRVLPSSGEETTVAAESENFDSWVAGD